MTDPLVTRADIAAAERAILGVVHRTPLVRSQTLSARLGVDLWFKLENFQKTGSFKVRGALHYVGANAEEARARGTVTFSAGNHAQALAWAASRVGAKATVVMPATAVQAKVDATRGYGGEVVLTAGSLVETVQALRDERGLLFVHPFDDPHIIAGQGTVGAEIVAELPDVETIVCGVGGGGMLAGLGVVARAHRDGIRVIGVEPEGADAMRRSLDTGQAVTLDRTSTIADGLAAPLAGRVTYAHVRDLALEVLTLDDAAIVDAMWTLMERCKLVVEPAAAAALAALLSGRVAMRPGERVVCVVSGGNVDRARLKALA
jgi:threonine dehydratase